jgi:hypothetical protein
MIWPTVGRHCLGVKPHLGPKTNLLLLSHSCRFVNVRSPLWREYGVVLYKCCWSSPAKSLSGPSLEGVMSIFYCLRFGFPHPECHIPQEQGGTVIPNGTEFPFFATYDSQGYVGGIWNFLYTNYKNCQSRSQSYTSITTDGQSASLSWCQAPVWDPRPIFLLKNLN